MGSTEQFETRPFASELLQTVVSVSRPGAEAETQPPLQRLHLQVEGKGNAEITGMS